MAVAGDSPGTLGSLMALISLAVEYAYQEETWPEFTAWAEETHQVRIEDRGVMIGLDCMVVGMAHRLFEESGLLGPDGQEVAGNGAHP